MKRGIVALLIVILVSVMGTFVLIGWQARLVTAILRSSSLSDMTAAAYAAESEIYDWAARFMGNYPDMFDPPLDSALREVGDEVLPDGTRLVVSASLLADGAERLLVKAERQFSTTNMELTRGQTSTGGSNYDSLEIGLALDCTTSMNEPADSFCREMCGAGGGNYKRCMDKTYRPDGSLCSTRLEEQKNAALWFVDSVSRFAEEHSDKEIRMGLVVFRVDAKWIVETSDGGGLEKVRREIENGMSRWHSDSSMCKKVSGATSIGSGFDLMNAGFSGTKRGGRKQVMVLISDGEPNTRSGGYTVACEGVACTDHNTCSREAMEYLKCSLRSVNDGGSRDPEVDAYVITVLDNPPGEVTNVFENYATEYFNSANARDLPMFLQDIFRQITTNFSKIIIRRVVPTFAP